MFVIRTLSFIVFPRLEEARRADSGLYSEDSERDEDTCPDRSSEHASGEADLCYVMSKIFNLTINFCTLVILP